MSGIFVNPPMVVVVIHSTCSEAQYNAMQLTNHCPGIWNRAVVRIEYETHTERTMKNQNQNPETLSLGCGDHDLQLGTGVRTGGCDIGNVYKVGLLIRG